MVDGHIYCDKAPGLSLAAVPVYAAAYPFAQGKRPRGRLIHLAAYLATVLCIGLPSALATAMLFRVAGRLGASPPFAAGLACAWAFGTQALPYATLFYGHQVAAALLLIAFGLLLEGRHREGGTPAGTLALAGLAMGVAIACEYPAVLAAAFVGLYALWVVRPWPRVAWLVAGMAVPLLGVALYHTVAFGGPFTTGYSSTVAPGRMGGLWLGITLPDFTLLDEVLFSLERGLIRHAPWLALAVPGAALLARSRTTRAEGLVAAAVMVVFLLFNLSLTRTPDDWRGGAGLGPRYLIPALPFWVMAIAGLSTVPVRPLMRHAAAAGFAALVLVSTGKMFLATAVQPEVDKVDDPWADWLLPHWRTDQVAISTVPFHGGPAPAGRQAWNLGEKMGLEGRASFLPLAAFVVLAGAWVTRSVAARPPTPRRAPPAAA